MTGTRIRRRDFQSPSPLVTIEREDIEFSGQPTLEEYLNKLPQLQPDSGRAQNTSGDGTAELNLRGLGPGRTLVLLNGRRVAPSGSGSAVDVNNLPSILIDRVEIITGGASTVYGSDAIAGVVNFITRDDFTGLSVEGGYNVTAEGDANVWDANLVYGLDLPNGGNLTFYVGRYEREEMFTRDREISSVVLSEDYLSGEWFEWGAQATPGGYAQSVFQDPSTPPTVLTWNPDGTPRAFLIPDDLYNYYQDTNLQNPLERVALGILGQVPISASWEAYFEVNYARNQAGFTQAPTVYGNFTMVNTDNPVLTPETSAIFSQPEFQLEPGLAGMVLASRLVGLGPRLVDYDRKYLRLLGGLRGSFGDGWLLDGWITYSDADDENRTFNTGSISRFQQGLLVDPATGECFDPGGGCVPVDLFGENRLSPQALDFIRVDDVLNTTTRTQWLASAVVTGSPFDIWSGPVDMAFGVEWRSDEVHNSADERLFTNDVLGFPPQSSIDGTETVYELYSEAIFTLFESGDSDQRVELEIGGRWSDYDNAGTVDTWKAGLNWQFTESLRLRTMVQHAVRAPNNQELFTEQVSRDGFFVGESTSDDPCSASRDPVGSGNAEKCILQGLSPGQVGEFEASPFYPTEFISGGNPDLEPESSDTFTVGAVFGPLSLPGLTIAVDYYDLEMDDTIGGIDPLLICFDPLNTAGVFCEDLKRDQTGNVYRYTSLIENRGVLATNGIDLQVHYTTDLPAGFALAGEYAYFSVGLMLTHVFSLDYQENVVTEVLDCAGKFGWPCQFLFQTGSGTYPEHKLITNFNYSSGPFTAHLSWRWIDGTDNAAPLGSETCCGVSDPVLAAPKVSSWNYLDFGLAYEWDFGLLARLGVNNLTDKQPPLMGDSAYEFNTDALLYDIFGRTYYLNLRYQFGF